MGSTGCDVPSRASSELSAIGSMPGVAQLVDPRRAEPLGQLALRRDQQRFVGEGGRGGAERGEHLQSGRRCW